MVVVVATKEEDFGLCQLSACIINKRSKKGHRSLHWLLQCFPRLLCHWLLLDWLPFYRMKGFLQIRSRIHSCWKLKAEKLHKTHNGWNLNQKCLIRRKISKSEIDTTFWILPHFFQYWQSSNSGPAGWMAGLPMLKKCRKIQNVVSISDFEIFFSPEMSFEIPKLGEVSFAIIP